MSMYRCMDSGREFNFYRDMRDYVDDRLKRFEDVTIKDMRSNNFTTYVSPRDSFKGSCDDYGIYICPKGVEIVC